MLEGSLWAGVQGREEVMWARMLALGCRHEDAGARMPAQGCQREDASAWTLKCVTGTCDTEEAQRPASITVFSGPQVAICPFCLLEFGEMDFPLDLTVLRSFPWILGGLPPRQNLRQRRQREDFICERRRGTRGATGLGTLEASELSREQEDGSELSCRRMGTCI